jgi:hypothetical protein
MDECVDGPITRGLRRRGVNVVTVQDDGREEAEDPDVLHRATELGHLLFTRDEDLLSIAAACQRSSEAFSGVVYAHQDDVTIGRCIEDLELIAKAGSIEEYASRVVFLPL